MLVFSSWLASIEWCEGERRGIIFLRGWFLLDIICFVCIDTCSTGMPDVNKMRRRFVQSGIQVIKTTPPTIELARSAFAFGAML